MKRKFAWIGFPFLLGLLAFSVGWGEYNLVFICAALVISLMGAICVKKYRPCILLSGIAFLSAISFAATYTYAVYNRVMEYSGKSVSVTGYVADYSYMGSDKGRLTVKGKIDNNKTVTITFFVPDDDFDYYDEVEIKGEVTAVVDSVDFQAEQYYRPKGVYLQGSKLDAIKRNGVNKHPVLKAVKHYRDYMFVKINNIVGGDEGGFLAAMLCGDKTELSDSTKQMLYRTGIGHIFSVSGIHIVIISAFFSLLLKLLPIGRKLRFLLMEIVIWGFALFAGFSPSVVRAAVMMTVILAADITNRHGDCLNSLGLCCVLLTFNNPYVVRAPSFLLSMSGAFAMGVVVPKITATVEAKGIVGGLLKSLLAMVAFMLVTMPVSMAFFDEISLAAPVSNVILVPICTVALCVTILTVVTGGLSIIAVPVLKFAGCLIKIVLYLSDKISSFRYSYITVSDTSLKILFICISLMGFTVIFLAKSHFKKLAFIVSLYALFVSFFNVDRILHEDETHIVLIQDKNSCQVMLYNGSSAVILDANAKGKHNSALRRLAEKRGVKDVQAVFISEECYYTSMKYGVDFLPVPSRFVGDFVDEDCGDVLSNYELYNFDDMTIRRNSEGFAVEVCDKEILISSQRFYMDGAEFEYDGYPIDFVLSDNSFEVRRLDYGFDEQ